MSSATLRRLIAPLAIMAIAALVAAPAVGAPKPNRHKVAACALGAQIMAEQAHGGVNAFDDQDDFANKFIKQGISDARPSGWGLSAWQRTLLTKQPPVNLFARCPELANRLPGGTRLATAADRAAVQRLGQMPRIYIGQIAAPSITADGRTALVMEFTHCSGLCGGGSLRVYKLVGQRWVKGEAVFTMIS
jgi:hypothetical protein